MDCRKLLSISALFTEINPVDKENIVEIRLVLWGMIRTYIWTSIFSFHLGISLQNTYKMHQEGRCKSIPEDSEVIRLEISMKSYTNVLLFSRYVFYLIFAFSTSIWTS
jgi:hypothetical protein